MRGDASEAPLFYDSAYFAITRATLLLCLRLRRHYAIKRASHDIAAA